MPRLGWQSRIVAIAALVAVNGALGTWCVAAPSGLSVSVFIVDTALTFVLFAFLGSRLLG